LSQRWHLPTPKECGRHWNCYCQGWFGDYFWEGRMVPARQQVIWPCVLPSLLVVHSNCENWLYLKSKKKQSNLSRRF
jgi:hypothetical protein